MISKEEINKLRKNNTMSCMMMWLIPSWHKATAAKLTVWSMQGGVGVHTVHRWRHRNECSGWQENNKHLYLQRSQLHKTTEWRVNYVNIQNCKRKYVFMSPPIDAFMIEKTLNATAHLWTLNRLFLIFQMFSLHGTFFFHHQISTSFQANQVFLSACR